MTILIDDTTRVLVQGITGKIGAFHTEEMIAYGTNIVGGVTPGQERHPGPRPAGLRHGQGRRRRHRRHRQHRLRPAALRRRLDHGGGRRRHPGLRRDHRRHPRAGHDPGQALHAPLQGREPHAADGPELCRRDQPRQCLLGIMPGHIYLRGPGRRRRPLGHAGLRGGRADEGAGHRHLDQRRDRRRSDQRQLVQGCAGAVRAGPRHRCRADDRRDRRARRRPRPASSPGTT